MRARECSSPRATRLVVLCRSKSEAASELELIRVWVEAAGLTLHPTKTQIVDSRTKSFVFLGYSFRGEKIYPRRESYSKIKARIVKLTARNRTDSIEEICKELTLVLRGWFYYFRHCQWTIFADLDIKIRVRLGRLLLRRHRNNPKRLTGKQCWTNDYFTKAGLFSLRMAHIRFGQSHQGTTD